MTTKETFDFMMYLREKADESYRDMCHAMESINKSVRTIGSPISNVISPRIPANSPSAVLKS